MYHEKFQEIYETFKVEIHIDCSYKPTSVQLSAVHIHAHTHMSVAIELTKTMSPEWHTRSA